MIRELLKVSETANSIMSVESMLKSMALYMDHVFKQVAVENNIPKADKLKHAPI